MNTNKLWISLAVALVVATVLEVFLTQPLIGWDAKALGCDPTALVLPFALMFAAVRVVLVIAFYKAIDATIKGGK
jgi:hypothetical protein